MSRINAEASEKEIPILRLILIRLANLPPQNSQIGSIRGLRNDLQQRIASLPLRKRRLTNKEFIVTFRLFLAEYP